MNEPLKSTYENIFGENCKRVENFHTLMTLENPSYTKTYKEEKEHGIHYISYYKDNNFYEEQTTFLEGELYKRIFRINGKIISTEHIKDSINDQWFFEQLADITVFVKKEYIERLKFLLKEHIFYLYPKIKNIDDDIFLIKYNDHIEIT